jgi:hypothetical protein
MNISLSSTLFILSLSFFSFSYGVAAAHYHLWPHPVIVEAKEALKAYVAAFIEEMDVKPPEFGRFEEQGFTGPTAWTHRDATDPGSEYIFMDGGSYQLTSHCPKYGCLAWIMDRDGKVIHTWEADPQAVWDDVDQVDGFFSAENVASVGAHLYPDGKLLIIYQGGTTFPYGVGIAMFDRDSRLLWKKKSRSHHWLSVDEQGFIYTPVFQEVELPVHIGDTHLEIRCPQGRMYEDAITVLDPDGNEVERIPLLETFIKSGYAGLIFEPNNAHLPLPLVYNECDPTHLNDVRVLTRADASNSDRFSAGDLLVSMRSLNSITVIDRKTRRIKWTATGRSVLQHSPRFLNGDRVLVFDNLGGPVSHGGSQLVSIDMNTNMVDVVFPTAASPANINFLSGSGGHIEVHKNGKRVLVSLSRQGRLVEADLESGQIVWEFVNTHDISNLYDDQANNGKKIARFDTQTATYVYDIAFPVNHEHHQE